jgi:hypothetical protein
MPTTPAIAGTDSTKNKRMQVQNHDSVQRLVKPYRSIIIQERPGLLAVGSNPVKLRGNTGAFLRYVVLA